MDPNAPSQPSLNTSYAHPSNPASFTPAETTASTSTSASQQRSAPTQETRRQDDAMSGEESGSQSTAIPSSLGYGVQDSSHDAPSALGGAPASNLDGEQMRAAGDGDIAAAQDSKGGFGEQESLTAGLDRKAGEQAGVKEARHGERGGGGVDVGSAMEGKSFVGAGENQNGGGEGMDGGLGMQTGHGQV